MQEFDLINNLTQAFRAQRPDTTLGIGDDAALVKVPADHELVLCSDTLIAGRHFPQKAAAADIGYRALAVNLSDIAAMGATPAWATIALALPELDATWCKDFIAGAHQAAQQAGIDIVGGDTTRGETSITVTLAGYVPSGQAIRRAGAKPSDVICVTGTLGDAALGLKLWQQAGDDAHWLQQRLMRPQWRDGTALLGLAHAALDISDGLVSDLGHILAASRVGAQIYLDQLPTSDAFARLCPKGQASHYQLAGGDDYELLITLPKAKVDTLAQKLAVPLTIIGTIQNPAGLEIVGADGRPIQRHDYKGWDHFSR